MATPKELVISLHFHMRILLMHAMMPSTAILNSIMYYYSTELRGYDMLVNVDLIEVEVREA